MNFLVIIVVLFALMWFLLVRPQRKRSQAQMGMQDNLRKDDEIITAGFDAATVHRVLRMVRAAEFKRKQAAPGLKVTDRAFGTGWRMPIAARPPLDDLGET